MVLFQHAFQAGRFEFTLSQSRVTAFFIHWLICATVSAVNVAEGPSSLMLARPLASAGLGCRSDISERMGLLAVGLGVALWMGV